MSTNANFFQTLASYFEKSKNVFIILSFGTHSEVHHPKVQPVEVQHPKVQSEVQSSEVASSENEPIKVQQP